MPPPAGKPPGKAPGGKPPGKPPSGGVRSMCASPSHPRSCGVFNIHRLRSRSVLHSLTFSLPHLSLSPPHSLVERHAATEWKFSSRRIATTREAVKRRTEEGAFHSTNVYDEVVDDDAHISLSHSPLIRAHASPLSFSLVQNGKPPAGKPPGGKPPGSASKVCVCVWNDGA